MGRAQDHAGHSLSADLHALAGQDARVQAAYTAEFQRAVGIAAHDHSAHFVHMRGQQHTMSPRALRTRFADNQIADRVNRKFVHVGGKLFTQDSPNFPFLPRDPAGVG